MRIAEKNRTGLGESHCVCASFAACRALISRLLLILLLLAAKTGNVGAGEEQVIDRIERIAITTEGIMMEAKVDTGADYSSVHADDIN